MSQQQYLQVPRQSDKALIKCFKKLAVHIEQTAFNLNVIGNPSFGVVQIDSDELKSLEKSNLGVIEAASITISGFNISYQRGGYPNINNIPKPKSPFYDEFQFGPYNNNNLDPSIRIQLASIVSKEMNAYSPGRGVGISEQQVQLESIHTATLERLQNLNEELISSTHEYRNKLDSEYSVKESNLEEEYKSKNKVLNDEQEKKNTEIENEHEALVVLKKEIDDRSNTHARREIRKDILKEIKSRQNEYKLTDGTIKLRRPIAYAMYLLISIFSIASIFSGIEFYKVISIGDTTSIAIAGLKQALYSFGAIGSIIYYIKWSNRWFEQHSSSEFQLKQLELDMERASWLVETSLEWKDAKGTAIPTELLASLSSNLFSSDQNKTQDILHPADQLASALLGSASSVKLKSGDSEIIIDPKKLDKSGKREIASNKAHQD